MASSERDATITVQSENRDVREQRLDAIIAEYYRLEETGETPDQTEFMAGFPEFQLELIEFFADLGMFQHSVRSESDDPALEPTITVPFDVMESQFSP